MKTEVHQNVWQVARSLFINVNRSCIIAKERPQRCERPTQIKTLCTNLLIIQNKRNPTKVLFQINMLNDRGRAAHREADISSDHVRSARRSIKINARPRAAGRQIKMHDYKHAEAHSVDSNGNWYNAIKPTSVRKAYNTAALNSPCILLL